MPRWGGVNSLRLGAVRMHETFLRSERVSDIQVLLVRAYMDQLVEATLNAVNEHEIDLIVCTAATSKTSPPLSAAIVLSEVVSKVLGSHGLYSPDVGLKDGVLVEIIDRFKHSWDSMSEETEIIKAAATLGQVPLASGARPPGALPGGVVVRSTGAAARLAG